MLEIELSHSCNIRCSDCAILSDIKANKHALSEWTILQVLYDASNVGITGYSLTGGEPFLHIPLIQKIIQADLLDCIKINTNGFVFSGEKQTRQIFERLKESGFGIRNRSHIAWLNISIGQQTAAGISLQCAVYAASLLQDFFPKESVKFSLNVYSKQSSYSEYTIDAFLSAFRAYTSYEYPISDWPIKVITKEGCYGLPQRSVFQSNKKQVQLSELIQFYANENLTLNCSNPHIYGELEATYPRMLLRADGSVYACTGFEYIHRLGTIHDDSLQTILKRCRSNTALQTAFSGGIQALYTATKEIDESIGETMVASDLSPCDLCGLLTSYVRN